MVYIPTIYIANTHVYCILYIESDALTAEENYMHVSLNKTVCESHFYTIYLNRFTQNLLYET